MRKRLGGKSEVGYRRPPRHTRFEKGRSGNPRGRPKGGKNVASVLLDSVHEAVTVREGGRRKNITKLEAMAKQLANKAASGDARASQLLVQMLQASEGRGDRQAPPMVMDEADERVVQQLFARVREMMRSLSPHAGRGSGWSKPAR